MPAETLGRIRPDDANRTLTSPRLPTAELVRNVRQRLRHITTTITDAVLPASQGTLEMIHDRGLEATAGIPSGRLSRTPSSGGVEITRMQNPDGIDIAILTAKGELDKAITIWPSTEAKRPISYLRGHGTHRPTRRNTATILSRML